VTRHLGISVTNPTCTLIDLATRLNRDQLEAAVNEADKRVATLSAVIRRLQSTS
jgi:hypothetical protein